jgi:CRISPR-associated exonuclease Cas4
MSARSLHAFSDLGTVAYCPRQLYYHRQHDSDREAPPEVGTRRELAFRYPEFLEPFEDSDPLADCPIALSPTQYRTNLSCASERLDCWGALCRPAEREVLLEGKECRGIAHKLLDLDSPVPSLVFTGAPPQRGVWQPHSVRAVAAAKALAWERSSPVERAFVEYATHGVIREVRLTTRRKAMYREAIDDIEAIDGPPARVDNDAKCEPCEYRAECGVETRSLRSLLGLG